MRQKAKSSYLLAHFTTDMCETLLAVEALSLKTTVSEHFGDLCVLLAVFTEDELALVIVVLVLSTSPIFTTLKWRRVISTGDLVFIY